MRIGFYTDIEGWGGSETFLRDLMVGVRDCGHDVVLIGVEGTRLAQEARALGFKFLPWRSAEQRSRGEGVTPVRSSREGWRRAWSFMPVGIRLAVGNLRQASRLSRLLAGAGLDVLHVNVNGYEVAGLAARRIRLPAVGCYLIVPPPEPNLVRRVFSAVTLRSYRRLVFQSEIGRDSVLTCRQRTGPVSVIPNAILLPTRQASPFSPGKRRGCRLLSMGRLHPMKGNANVIRALSLIPDPDCTLEILGDGPEESMLKELTRTLRIEHRVTFAGHVDDFLPRLCSADAFVMASVSHESCPASLLFAMAVGLPVVTSDLPALTEVNRPGVTGCVVRAGDSAALAAAVRGLCEAPESAVCMGQAGRARVAERFSMPAMVRDWVRVYESLALRCGRRHVTRRGG